MICDNDAQVEILKEWNGIDRRSQWLWVRGVWMSLTLCVSAQPSSPPSSWQYFPQGPVAAVSDRSTRRNEGAVFNPTHAPLHNVHFGKSSDLECTFRDIPLCERPSEEEEGRGRPGCGNGLPWVLIRLLMVWDQGQPLFQPRPPHL